MKFITYIAPFFCTYGLLSGCATEELVDMPELEEFEVVDMSGNWEKDYQQSDDFETEFNLYVFDIQRQINAQNDGLNNRATLGGGTSR